MSFRDRIINFVYTEATGKKRQHVLMTILGGCFFSGVLLGTILLAFLSDRFLHLRAWPPPPMNFVLAFPLLAAGIWLWVWSVETFLKANGTPVPLSPPPKLVDTGPYAYSRNPMLSGVFLLLFGIGFLCRSISLITVYTPLFMVISFFEFRTIEEPELEKRLGAPYAEYRKRVSMFFPFPGRRRKDR